MAAEKLILARFELPFASVLENGNQMHSRGWGFYGGGCVRSFPDSGGSRDSLRSRSLSFFEENAMLGVLRVGHVEGEWYRECIAQYVKFSDLWPKFITYIAFNHPLISLLIPGLVPRKQLPPRSISVSSG